MKFLSMISCIAPLVALVKGATIPLSSRVEGYPSNFDPNFGTEGVITIQHPIDKVFNVFGTNGRLCDAIRQSSIASDCELLAQDTVSVDGPLTDAFVRDLPPSDRGFPRQHFKYIETIKIIPGLPFLDVKVHLTGTHTWDEETKTSLIEINSDQNVAVRKTRFFEQLEDGATRFTEKVEGQCNPLLLLIVQNQADTTQKEVMAKYPSLVE